MKIQSFENLGLDDQGGVMITEKGDRDVTNKSETSGVADPENTSTETIANANIPKVVDRRPQFKRPGTENPDDKFFEMAKTELSNSGQPVTPESIRSTALKIKFQEIPEEAMVGKYVDAMLTNPETAKNIKDKAQVGLNTDFRIEEMKRKKEQELIEEEEQNRKREEVERVRAETSRKTAEVIAKAKQAKENSGELAA